MREKEKRRCGLCSKPLPNGSPFTNCASCMRRVEQGEKPADIMTGKKPAKDGLLSTVLKGAAILLALSYLSRIPQPPVEYDLTKYVPPKRSW